MNTLKGKLDAYVREKGIEGYAGWGEMKRGGWKLMWSINTDTDQLSQMAWPCAVDSMEQRQM